MSLDSSRRGILHVCVSFLWVCALFTGPTSMEKYKFYFKTGIHSTIHTFKNYFTIMFSTISFQISTISNITDPKNKKEKEMKETNEAGNIVIVK